MKKIFLLLAIFLGIFDFTYAQKIGIFVEGVPQFTINKSDLITTFQNNLLEFGQIDADFKDVEIRSFEGAFFLTFIGEGIKSTLSAYNENDILIVDGKTSCTSTDFSSESLGCIPRPLSGGCSPSNKSGKCSKTVSDFSLIE
ncbi:MAG TPA: hypothetical protein VLZ83_14655 [Edaphocola sp.]|nr:hypothetical protein [Edaphocola sp.]